jgi:NAD(P)-dependent dehydrogenase (short-subunit alcohol dehydrogenase family)
MKTNGAKTLNGKVCLVTGANAGIGKETAIALAKMGAEVVMVARNPEKGNAALEDVRKASGSAKVSLLIADLSSQASIRALAAEFLRTHAKLDVLVNNAGAVHTERTVTVDGLETTFATNHLAYFLLTNLLLGALKAATPSRIVNVASEAHKSQSVDLADLQSEKTPYSGYKVYGASKMANILFTYELARRLEGTGVTANCLHPGVIRSNYGLNTRGIFRLGIALIRPFLIGPEKGAETSIYLASSPEVEGVTGKYFKRKRPAPTRKAANNRELAKGLWEASAKLTKLESI